MHPTKIKTSSFNALLHNVTRRDGGASTPAMVAPKNIIPRRTLRHYTPSGIDPPPLQFHLHSSYQKTAFLAEFTGLKK
jgi:hypothetical protein